MPQSLQHPVDLDQQELEVDLKGAGPARMDSHHPSHPANRALVGGEQLDLDVHPIESLLERDNLTNSQSCSRLHTADRRGQSATSAVTILWIVQQRSRRAAVDAPEG